MCASWNDKFKVDIIANKLEQIKTYEETSKNLKFSGLPEYYEYFTVLCSIVILADNIPEIEKHRLLSQAISSAGKKGGITAKSLLKEISILEQEFIKRPKINYVMAALLSIKNDVKIRKYKIGSTLITFAPRFPTSFNRNRAALYSKVRSIAEEIPTDYLAVRVFINARSVNEAWERASRDLDLLRGIWNFGLNRLTTFHISFGGRPKPINKFLLGPFHTLHEMDGKLATETFWYETNFKSSMTSYEFDDKKKYDYLLSFTKFIRNKINRCTYKEVISEAIIRYGQALDYYDYEVSFLRLWSVLEILTNTFKETYEKTIRRTAFTFHDYDFHYQVLNHLREFRNKTVHSGSSDNTHIKTYLYQLKGYVENMLEFHLTNKNRFHDMTSMTEFLDLPPNRSALIKKDKLYQKGIKFLSE